MKRLALVASFCGIALTQMMAQNINGELISDTTLFDKFSKELCEASELSGEWSFGTEHPHRHRLLRRL